MGHPLRCNNCGDYRYIEFAGVNFNDIENKKGFGVKIPFFVCKHCDNRQSILPEEKFLSFKDEMLTEIKDGEFFDMPLKYVFSKLDSEKHFKDYDHLGFQYDSLGLLFNSWLIS